MGLGTCPGSGARGRGLGGRGSHFPGQADPQPAKERHGHIKDPARVASPDRRAGA